MFPRIAHADASSIMLAINTQIINPLITVLFAVAIVVFMFGVIEFLANTDNEEKRDTGKKHMIWGIVGLFIMASAIGIMHLIINTIS